MSQEVSKWLVSGLFHPNSSPIYKDRWNNPLILTNPGPGTSIREPKKKTRVFLPQPKTTLNDEGTKVGSVLYLEFVEFSCRSNTPNLPR